MRQLQFRTARCRTVAAGTALVAAALLATMPAAARAASTVRPPVSVKGLLTQEDGGLLTRDDEEFAAALELAAQRAEGVPFAEHEIEILDAWQAGLPVAQIEAETLLSGAIYRLFVEGSPASDADRDLIDRWRSHRAAHMAEIVARAAELVGGQGRALRVPDGSRDWELYWDPELYNQLSSAYQQRLRRTYGNRTRARGASAPVVAGAEAPEGAIANILVNNPAADATVQDTQSETSLVLGTGSNVLVSFNDSGSEETGTHFTGVARSTDGGASFTDQGVLPASAQGDAGDPVYARNNVTGRIILSTLGFTTGSVLQCFTTDNDGAVYSAPVNCAAGGGNHDKEWIACDNAAGAGQGTFYNFWRDFGAGGGMTFARSIDGGVNWGSRQVLAASSGQGAWVVTGADHAVYAFWLKSAPNRLVLRKSTNLGVSFGAEIPVTTLRTTGVNGDFGLLGGFRSNAFPQVVAHPTDPNQLYITWADKAVSGADKSNVYFSRTLDGGATWAPPVQVNQDTGTQDNWSPVIAITPDGTKLLISWYDRRNDPANLAIDVYGHGFQIDGTDVLSGSDYRITDVSFPVVVGQDPIIAATYMGDYDQAVADNTSFYRTWGDNRLPLLTHAHQPDVRFAEVPVEEGFGPNPISGPFSLDLLGCGAGNGVPDPGEVLDVDLTVTNDGTAPLANLVGTLQATGGVTSPSAPRTYGAMAPGESVTRSFTFTAGGECNDGLVFNLQLQDGVTSYGVVTFGPQFMGVETTTPFANAAAITINDNAAATPYPSSITVSGITGYQRVTLDLVGLGHTFPEDIDVIAVAPTGARAYVMSDVGGGTDIAGVNLTFDDSASGSLSSSVITSGTYTPSNIDTGTDGFPGPAPAGPYDGTFANLSSLGAAANGSWSLFVRDDVGTDAGTISGGWGLSFVARNCAAACGDLFADDFETANACRWSAAQGNAGSC